MEHVILTSLYHSTKQKSTAGVCLNLDFRWGNWH